MRRRIPFSTVALATLLAAIIACSSTPVPGDSIHGTVISRHLVALPREAMLRVDLVEMLPEGGLSTPLSSHVVRWPGGVAISFELAYEPTAVDPGGQYGLVALISHDHHLLMISPRIEPVRPAGDLTTVELRLEPIGDLERVADQELSILFRGIQAELEEDRNDAGDYERLTPLRAADVLPPELASGPHHEVRERVVSYGPQNHYWVDSDFGPFYAQGDAMLRRTIREIEALATLRELSRTEEFAKAVGRSLTKPFVAAHRLVVDPVDTISGVPTGLWSALRGAKASIGGTKSDYEDNEAEALVSLSKYKRRYAAQLGVDAYSTNRRLQTELNRFGWLAVAGAWTPSLVSAPISAPISPVVTSLDWIQSLDEMIAESSPSVLRDQNDTALLEMGVAEDVRRRFLDHASFSPRHTTIIVQCLASMGGVTGRDRMVEMVSRARSEIEAFTSQQIVEMLAGYHREAAPLAEIQTQDGMPALGRSQDGAAVLCFPVDYGRWTRFSASLLEGYSQYAVQQGMPKVELWITGKLSPRARRETTRLGIAVREDVGKMIGMMDGD